MHNEFQNLENIIEQNTAFEKVCITHAEKLSGGAIQENWKLEAKLRLNGKQQDYTWVLRCDADSAIKESLARHEEYQLMSLLYEQGIKVPKPWLFGELSNNKTFYLMDFVQGETRGFVLVKENMQQFDPEHLVDELAQQLALLHSIKPSVSNIAFLKKEKQRPALLRLKEMKVHLAEFNYHLPVLNLAADFLIENIPPEQERVLTHRDFRVGNIMVSDSLQAVLDWEFCAWSEAYEDLGWFCAPCWRFKQYANEAGGLTKREQFIAAYEKYTQTKVNRNALNYWEIYAVFRWAMIALDQGQRHHSGEQQSLTLLLTEYIVFELNQILIDQMRAYRA